MRPNDDFLKFNTCSFKYEWTLNSKIVPLKETLLENFKV